MFNAGNGSHYVWLNNGDGTFPSSYSWQSDPGYANLSIRLGDFNGDGKTDIHLFNAANGNHIVWLNNGDGTFPSAYS
jgi:hypothetical protein